MSLYYEEKGACSSQHTPHSYVPCAYDYCCFINISFNSDCIKDRIQYSITSSPRPSPPPHTHTQIWVTNVGNLWGAAHCRVLKTRIYKTRVVPKTLRPSGTFRDAVCMLECVRGGTLTLPHTVLLCVCSSVYVGVTLPWG